MNPTPHTFAPSLYSNPAGEEMNMVIAEPRRARSGPSTLSIFMGLMGPVAMGLSYAQNKSIPWAIVHSFVAPAYLAYRGVEYAKEK